MRAATARTARIPKSSREVEEAAPVTLLHLVGAVAEVTDDDREVVATVLHMLRSGSVRLCGNFRDTPVEDLS